MRFFRAAMVGSLKETWKKDTNDAAPLAGEKAGVDGFSSGNKWKLV